LPTINRQLGDALAAAQNKLHCAVARRYSGGPRVCQTQPTLTQSNLRLAFKARNLTQKLMEQASRIELQQPQRHKNFRILAKVMVDGNEVAQALIEAALAAPYDVPHRSNYPPSGKHV
jgi:endonuclease YncB( thermonuclease family)